MTITPVGSNPVNFAQNATPVGNNQSSNPTEPTVAQFLETPRYDKVELAKEKRSSPFDFEDFPEFKSREELIENGETLFLYSSYMTYDSVSKIPYFSSIVRKSFNPDVFDQLAEAYLTAKENIMNRSSDYQYRDHLSTEELLKDLDNQFGVAIHDIARSNAYKVAAALTGNLWYYEGLIAHEERTSFHFNDRHLAEYKAEIEKGIYDDVAVYGKLLYEKLASGSFPTKDFDVVAYLDEQAKGLDTNFSVSEFRDFSTALSALNSGDGKALAGALTHLDNTDRTSGNSALFDNMKNFLNRKVFIDVILRPESIFVWGDGEDLAEARDYFYQQQEQKKEVKKQFLQYMKAHQNADKPNVIMELLERKGEAYYGEAIRAIDDKTVKAIQQSPEKASEHLLEQTPESQAAEALLPNAEAQGTEALLPNAKAQRVDISQIIAQFLRERNEENYSNFLELKEPGVPSDE